MAPLHKSPELMAFKDLWGPAPPLVASFQVHGHSVLLPQGRGTCYSLGAQSFLT